MASISIKQIANELRDTNGDVEKIQHPDEMFEYMQAVESSASEIIGDLSREELSATVSLMQTALFLYFVERGNLIMAFTFTQGNQDMLEALAVAFKISVDIATMEEWH